MKYLVLIIVLVSSAKSKCYVLSTSYDQVYMNQIRNIEKNNEDRFSTVYAIPSNNNAFMPWMGEDRKINIDMSNRKTHPYDASAGRKSTCALGTAEIYLSWWINTNGTLNIPADMKGR